MTDTTTPVLDTAAVADRYVRFWNPGAPAELTEKTFTPDVEYCTPIGVLSGPDALLDFRRQFAEHNTQYAFRVRTEPEGHHDRVRIQWEIATSAADPFAQGSDILTVDPAGRVAAVTAFLDRAPEGFDPTSHD